MIKGICRMIDTDEGVMRIGFSQSPKDLRSVAPGYGVVVMGWEEYEKLVKKAQAAILAMTPEKAEALKKTMERHPGTQDLSMYCEACRQALLRQREVGGVVYLCQKCSAWKVQA